MSRIILTWRINKVPRWYTKSGKYFLRSKLTILTARRSDDNTGVVHLLPLMVKFSGICLQRGNTARTRTWRQADDSYGTRGIIAIQQSLGVFEKYKVWPPRLPSGPSSHLSSASAAINPSITAIFSKHLQAPLLQPQNDDHPHPRCPWPRRRCLCLHIWPVCVRKPEWRTWA